jgi:hypothetical protein
VHGSFSLLGGSTFGAGYSPAINTTVGADLAASVEVRALYRGLVIAPSLGVKVTGVSQPLGPTAAALGVMVVPGVGVGYQLAVRSWFAIGGVAGYRLAVLAAGAVVLQHVVTVEVPATFHVGHNGIVEAFVQGGVTHGGLSTSGGSATSSQTTGTVAGGVRFGVTL